MSHEPLPGPDEPGASLEQLPAPEEISGTLRDILSGPDFATFDPPVGNPFFTALLDRIQALIDWIRTLFERDVTGLVPALAVLIPLLALTVAGILVFRKWRGTGRRAGEVGESSVEHVPATAGEWLRLATQRAGEGYFRSAGTALYQGFLLTLDGRRALAFHPSKTPGDYAREIAGGHGAGADAHAGGRFLSSFQGFSFGQERTTDEGYEDLARLAREAGCPAEGADTEPESG